MQSGELLTTAIAAVLFLQQSSVFDEATISSNPDHKNTER
jgi:hypothetical protein